MRSEQKMALVLGIFIAIFLIFAIVIYVTRNTGTYEYDNGYDTFIIQEIKDEEIEYSKIMIYLNGESNFKYLNLIYGPRQLEDIPVDFKRDDLLTKELIYITFDPGTNLSSKGSVAAIELAKVISNKFLYDIPTEGATTSESNGYPIITCSDVNETTGVIYMKMSNQTEIYSKEGCIIMTGANEDDLIRSADKLGLILMEIMRQ